MLKRTLKLLALITAFALMGGLSPAYAEPAAPSAYQVKAAFLYNFTKFVELPASDFTDDADPITICIVGEDPFGEAIKVIAGKVAKHRRLAVRYATGTEKIRHCQVVFICRSEGYRLSEVLKDVEGTGVLTVSDIDGFTKAGGMIGLVAVDKKVRFKINLKAAQRAGLKISSQLLKLALDVEGGDQ